MFMCRVAFVVVCVALSFAAAEDGTEGIITPPPQRRRLVGSLRFEYVCRNDIPRIGCSTAFNIGEGVGDCLELHREKVESMSCLAMHSDRRVCVADVQPDCQSIGHELMRCILHKEKKLSMACRSGMYFRNLKKQYGSEALQDHKIDFHKAKGADWWPTAPPVTAKRRFQSRADDE
jgi:hypothetical protein